MKGCGQRWAIESASRRRGQRTEVVSGQKLPEYQVISRGPHRGQAPSNHWVRNTYRVSHVLQRGRKRMDQAVRQLGQEANSVHIQDTQVRGQQPLVYRDIKSRKWLVPRLQSSLTRQSLDECGLPWGEAGETVALSAAQPRAIPTLMHLSLLTTVGVSHH